WPHELTLLDYGCGSGVLSRKLAQSGHSVTGVDQSVNMLAEAAKNMYGIPRRLMPRLIHSGVSDETAYADRQYDGILCLGVLEYVENPPALAAQLAENLKPGGFLMVSVPN